MRTFLLGLVTGVLAVVVGLAAVVLVAADPGRPGAAGVPPQPGATSRPLPSPPTDLRRGETWLQAVVLDSSAVLTSDGGFRDVHATGQDVRMTSSGLRAGTLRLVATLPFDAAARQVGRGVQLYAAGGGKAGVRRTTTLLGRQVQVRATGTVRAVGGQLVIEPETVDLGGPEVLDAALSATVRRLVTIRHTVQGLPAGMRLTHVEVTDGGFRATLDGTGVVLTG
ncbi:LmeA family phospholipid-binding protein [Pedococcus cremeus]|uniref:LmeA family phospholipid-binding protein n=1 Tax=Pedococcus cremeus TaxID=587636 RepID=UPI0015A5D39F|nr:LmeA family phospholipid-binding protein [Pedococcus cremeus]